jgi:hypothetical protein
MESLREIFFKIDRIHLFDVRCWTFDVRRSSVSFPIKLAAVQASCWAHMKLLEVHSNFKAKVNGWWDPGGGRLSAYVKPNKSRLKTAPTINTI